MRAVLEHAVGAELAAQFAVFAGDVVPAKKPAPDIYLLALRELGVGPERGRRRRGQRQRPAGRARRRAADGRHREQLHRRRGLHRGVARRDARSATSPTTPPPSWPTRTASTSTGRSSCRTSSASSTHLPTERERPPCPMPASSPSSAPSPTACIENEKYFGDLDSVVGDGDFGFSLARGFENVVDPVGHVRPHRHRHVPAEGRHRDDRAGSAARRDRSGAPRSCGRPAQVKGKQDGHGRRRGRDAAGRDRGHQGARRRGPRREDAPRRARAR